MESTLVTRGNPERDGLDQLGCRTWLAVVWNSIPTHLPSVIINYCYVCQTLENLLILSSGLVPARTVHFALCKCTRYYYYYHLLWSLLLYTFISPEHDSSSMKYSKHNIQQNEQTRKEKNFILSRKVSKFTLKLCYSILPQIAWHIKWKTFLVVI